MVTAGDARRRVRPTTPEDVERDGPRFTWMKPDRWREGFRSLVLEVPAGPEGHPLVIGVGRVGPNAAHPGRDLAEVEIDPTWRRQGQGTALIRELHENSGKPLSSKVVVGSGEEAFVRSLGAHTYLHVPLLRVDLTSPRTRRWARTVRDAVRGNAARLHSLSDLPRDQVVEALLERYLWQHASWSPTAPREVMRSLVGEEFSEETDRGHSWAVVREGRITALVDLFPRAEGADPEHREAGIEAVDASAPWARHDVALCLAALVDDVAALGARTLDFDNHPTDPHAAPLLATLRATAHHPVDLVEIPGGLTATLHDLPADPAPPSPERTPHEIP